MRRWGHPHSVTAGLVGGLLLLQHGWLLLAALGLAFTLGWLARGLRDRIGGAAHAVGSIVEARVRTEIERGKNVRAVRRVRVEQARDRRDAREKRETTAYWRGVRDGTPS